MSSTSKYDLKEPGYNLLGGILIICGVYLLVFDSKRVESSESKEVEAEGTLTSNAKGENQEPLL